MTPKTSISLHTLCWCIVLEDIGIYDRNHSEKGTENWKKIFHIFHNGNKLAIHTPVSSGGMRTEEDCCSLTNRSSIFGEYAQIKSIFFDITCNHIHILLCECEPNSVWVNSSTWQGRTEGRHTSQKWNEKEENLCII
jgi:hypothetical protein